MLEHSEFVNIKYKKECNDATKGKISTVIGRKIAAAVKESGADPTSNSKPRDVIVKAEANNMLNDTTDRSIKRAADDANSVSYGALTYEGYGSDGAAIAVDTLIGNRNHMVANMRDAFTKDGGDAGILGSVSYMFDKEGQVITDKEKCGMDPDELMILALDVGAKDFSEEKDSYEIATAPEDFNTVRETLEAQSIPTTQVDVTMIP